MEFPAVVGVIAAQKASLPQAVFSTLRDVFKKLAASSPFGVIIVHSENGELSKEIAQAASDAGVNCREIETAPSSIKEEFSATDMELVEAIDLLLLISRPESPDAHSLQNDFIAYARNSGRSMIRIDAVTGALDGDIPRQIEVDQGWLPELFAMAGLPPGADLETIKSKMSALANKSAPLTRSKWNWVVFLQGVAVCVPLGWLLGFPVRIVGLVTFTSTLLLFALHRWLRWWSMQKTWAQARLVAEATRSLIATARYPRAFPWRTFVMVPSLRPLRWAKRPTDEEPFDKWIEHYIENRLSVQQEYFTDKRKDAEEQRKKLTSWTTRLLDAAMVFALVALVLVFTPSGDEWMVGGAFSPRVLGSLSVLILLGLLLVQIVRELHELNRRTARFAQQELLARDAIARLNRVQSPKLGLEIVSTAESQLLTEVLEWYFHAETAERFVEVRARTTRTLPQNFLKQETAATRFAHSIPGKAGTAGLFVLQGIVGRLPYIVLPAAVVVVWIFYHLPDQGADIEQLEGAVHLLAADAKSDFRPSDQQTDLGANGYVVLVHGLWGVGIFTKDETENKRNWMKPLAEAISGQMKDKGVPAICLVDWSKAARPSDFYNRVFGETSYLADIPAIRAQAYRAGDIAAYKLAGVILSNNLPRNVPLHLIGHSAGGFVVTRIARRLCELGLTDESMVHVTILDTPAPDKEITETLPALYPNDAVDFYISSDIGGRLETLHSARFSPHIHRYDVPAENSSASVAEGTVSRIFDTIKSLPNRATNMWVAHQYSYAWYKKTVEHPENFPHEGFNRSPLLHQPQSVGRP